MYSLIIRDLLGRRDYYSKDQIIQFVQNSKKFNPTLEDLDQSTALLIFQTSKQQTWLVSTNQRLYCILDDNREDELHINWSISHDLNLEIKVREYPEKKDIGIIDIGEKKNWLYSRNLFKKQNIKDRISLLSHKETGIIQETDKIHLVPYKKYEKNKMGFKNMFNGSTSLKK